MLSTSQPPHGLSIPLSAIFEMGQYCAGVSSASSHDSIASKVYDLGYAAARNGVDYDIPAPLAYYPEFVMSWRYGFDAGKASITREERKMAA